MDLRCYRLNGGLVYWNNEDEHEAQRGFDLVIVLASAIQG